MHFAMRYILIIIFVLKIITKKWYLQYSSTDGTRAYLLQLLLIPHAKQATQIMEIILNVVCL
jgi:hypothetical protein